ncbi:MAG: IS21 family transposase [Pirellulaceae bacterium]|jgi:transposase|nr:IS21 family transposase [Pirellulaceae bacterium]
MKKWIEIRRVVLSGEISKREACRKFAIGWRTLARILEHDEPPGYQLKKPRPKRKLEPLLPILHEILEQDRKAPRKQRHTAQRIFDRLVEKHKYDGGITIVKDAVRAWKHGQAEVFVPLSHRPGDAQADFGEATVVLDGTPTKVAFFVITLPYSDAIFCQVFPKECTETFQEGHRRAFEFFGGVPKRISYDNSKIAVAKIAGGRGREATREFLRLQSHYLFEHHFCRVRRPNEKGHVENLLGFARRNYLVPVPQVDSLENLNAELVRCLKKDLKRHLRGKSATKEELLAEELKVFRPIGDCGFESRRVETPRANSLSLVRFDGNDYSVPTAFAHHQVTVVGGIEQVRLAVGSQLVARHPRHWGKEHTEFNPIHYLALLERKPGAFDYARPLEGWELPGCFAVLRRRQQTQLEKLATREFIKVLRLLEHASLSQLTEAVRYALQIGATSADALRLILQHRQEKPIDLFCLDGRPHLKGVQVSPPDLTAYQSLRVGA